MEENIHLGPMTSYELAYLWVAYQYETMARCGLTFFLQHIEDEPIQMNGWNNHLLVPIEKT